jgi:hypothetical protein
MITLALNFFGTEGGMGVGTSEKRYRVRRSLKKRLTVREDV